MRLAMVVQVKLFGTFRIGRFSNEKWEFSDNLTVALIIAELGIPENAPGFISVNDITVNKSHVVKDGDTLSIFPVLGGG